VSSHAAIETEDLTKRYGGTVALDRLNLTVDAGEIFGFLGPNGAGKTTTIKLLCGIARPTSGRGRVGGFDVERESDRVRETIGYMSQRFGLYGDLTVRENVEFFGGVYIRDRHEAKHRCKAILEEMGLAEWAGQLASALSGGWKQRLALATAIVHEPKILFLDEPTAGVDPVSRRTLWDRVYALQGRGMTLFVTTHYMEEAERCNRIGFIDRGRLVAVGTPETIKKTRMEGEVLRVEGRDLQSVLHLVRESGLARDANLYGNEVHAVVDSAADAIPRLRSYLEGKGASPGEITPISTSIEDVFVHLTRRT